MSELQKNVFHFEPTFEKLEALLKVYQLMDQARQNQVLEIEVLPDFWNCVPGYPDVARNCWLTLKFTVEQMENTFRSGKSLVQIRIHSTERRV